MNIVVITQDDPFYLADNLNYFFKNLPKNVKISGCILADASPFGKRETFKVKIKRTYKTFGILFFIHYCFEYILHIFNPDKRVKNILKKYDVPIIKINGNINSENSLNLIKSFTPDLLVSILGNQIFKQPLIDLAPRGCLNLHSALLPKYRGLMPSFWVLKNNEKETGVSVFFVDKSIDSGPILVQKKISICKGMTQSQLIRVSKKICMDAINLIQNSDVEKTYFSFPTRKDVKEFYKSGKRFY